jgi:hypothetical protein
MLLFCLRLGAALGIVDHLRRRFARFKLCTDLLDLRRLLSQICGEELNLLLLQRNSSFFALQH